ncbi:MAG TPA: hypothetical protein VJJ72_00865 [Candidatus Paceibacterota bacterium]
MKTPVFLAFLFAFFFSFTQPVSAKPTRDQLKIQIREQMTELKQRCSAFSVTCFAEWDREDPLGNRVPLIIVNGWNPESVPGRPRMEVWEPLLLDFIYDDYLYRHYKIYFFAYDSNIENAEELGRRMRDAIDLEGDLDDSFKYTDHVILGHSLGGLVAYSYMRETASGGMYPGRPSGERVRRVITFGAPFHGSPLANGPARDNKAGAWSLELITFDLLFFLFGTPSAFQINRSDLRWDNYDSLLNYSLFGVERNRWLERLYTGTNYLQKVIAYGSTYNPGNDCSGTPLAYRAYCYGRRILLGAMGLESDGVVPLASSLFYDSQGRPRIAYRQFRNYNHSEIVSGGGRTEIFQNLRQDLIDAAIGWINDEPLMTKRMDFNSDGIGDIFRYSSASGQWVMELANGRGSSQPIPGNWSSGWQVQAGDFDANGMTDFFLINSLGQWFKVVNRGGGNFSYFNSQWSRGWKTYIVDLDADRRSDVFLYNPASGQWFMCLTVGEGDFAYASGYWSANWKVYPADFDGDGRKDFFLYDPLDGTWFQAFTTGFGSFRYVNGYFPVPVQVYPADMNNDGYADLFVYNPHNGYFSYQFYRGEYPSHSITGYTSPGWQVHMADMDNSNTLDLFLYDSKYGSWEIVYLTPNTTFFTERGNWSPGWQIHMADLNFDLWGDVLLYSPDSGAYFQVINTGYGSFAYYPGNWGLGWSILSRR